MAALNPVERAHCPWAALSGSGFLQGRRRTGAGWTLTGQGILNLWAAQKCTVSSGKSRVLRNLAGPRTELLSQALNVQGTGRKHR